MTRSWQIVVRRGEEAHVERRRLRPAHRLHLPRLQHPQQLGLQGQGQVPDLVEEERPPVGELEAPGLPLAGAGEGPLLVPEQLGLQQRLGDGAAVEGHEGLAAPLALPVDRLRHDLLAGAGLAQDQHGQARGGDDPHLIDDPLRLRAGAHLLRQAGPFADLPPQVTHLAAERAVLQRPPHHQ